MSNVEKSAANSDDARVKNIIRRVAGEGLTLQQSMEAYKEWSNNYDKDMEAMSYKAHTLVSDTVLECYSPEQRGTQKILDVGAGTGLVARELKKHGFVHIDGLDPSPEMLDVAKADNLYENYIIDFLSDTQLSIPDNTYDMLTSAGGFAEGAHIPVAGIYEMIRLVKPGGYIVIATRLNVIETVAEYKDLIPVMQRLEEERKWKRIKKDISEKLYSDRQAIVFLYQVL